MFAIILAAPALVVAGYALYCVRRTEAAVAEWAEAQDEIEVEPETAELWISEGDMHAPDWAALYDATGAIALCMSEGVPCAVVKGQGVVSLHKLLSAKPTVQAIK